MRGTTVVELVKENHSAVGLRKPAKNQDMKESLTQKGIDKKLFLLILKGCLEYFQEDDLQSVCPNSPGEMQPVEIDDVMKQCKELISSLQPNQSIESIYPYVKNLIWSYKRYNC